MEIIRETMLNLQIAAAAIILMAVAIMCLVELGKCIRDTWREKSWRKILNESNNELFESWIRTIRRDRERYRKKRKEVSNG